MLNVSSNSGFIHLNMKKVLLSIFIAFLCNVNSTILAQYVVPDLPKTRTHYICYTVPISTTTETDNFGKITGFTTDLHSEEFAFLRLSDKVRREFVETVFEKVKSGQVVAYTQESDTYGTLPNENFQDSINQQNIQKYFGQMHTTSALSDNGEMIYDEQGYPVEIEEFSPYTTDDISSITFHENWILNTTTNVLEKQVVGYGLNEHLFGDDEEEYLGERTIFWIRCLDQKIENENLITIANNIETITQIVNAHSIIFEKNMLNKKVYTTGWEYVKEKSAYDYRNFLPGLFRYSFISESNHAPFMSTNKELPIYEANLGFSPAKDNFPYSKILSKKEIKKSGGKVVEWIEEDANWDLIYSDTVVPYDVHDIIKLGFIEDWSFDKENLTIQKKIKGLMPMVLNVNPETDEVLGFKKLYCMRYED